MHMVWVVLLSDFIAGVKGVFAVTITQLQYFKAIAAHENISCAAQELFISQSSLSMSLKKLEDELGRPLFDRYKNRLRLNPDGKELLSHVDVILSELAAIEHGFLSRSFSDGITVLSPLASFFRYCIPRLKSAFPSIPISSGFIDSKKIMEALLLGRADIVLSPFSEENDPRISAEYLTEEEYVVAVPLAHPLSSREELFFRDIDREKFALVRTGSYNSDFFFQQLAEHNIHLQIEIYEDSMIYYNSTPQVKDSLMMTSNFGQDYFNKEALVRFLPLKDFNGIPIYAVCLKKYRQKLDPIISVLHEIVP